jgi:hypothetical protein
MLKISTGTIDCLDTKKLSKFNKETVLLDVLKGNCISC